MSKDFEFAVKDDEQLKIGEHKWYGREDQTEDTLMHDTGKGEPIVIRQFEFKLNPGLTTLPTKDELITPEYLRELQTQLWADGLRLVLQPRVDINKERCIIFAPCQATSGNSFVEEPKLLQEWI